MVELDNLKIEIREYEEPLFELKASLDLDNKANRIAELERKMEEPGFWDDPQKSQKESQLLGDLRNDVKGYAELETKYADMLDLIDMANDENDESMIDEIKADFESFRQRLDEMKTATLLSEKYDDANAIININAGAGGTESCDWASMLYRMYGKWADRHGYKIEELDMLPGDEAGIKSVEFQVNGLNAYGFLKSEKGVHRLVRISPFNAQGKRQTSFVSVDVMPDIEEDIDIDIKPEDIRVDTYRSSGAGGQHINKTSSAIRITHFPTGIVVTCQNERSQFQNKDKAMQILKSKLYILAKENNAEKLSEIRGEVKDNAWGSQIRSYFLQPYQLVKDLRTECEIAQADSVLDGNIDPFINAYLKWMATRRKEENKQI